MEDARIQTKAAARSVLTELLLTLGEYRKDVLMVKGWVPESLLTYREWQQIKSLNVDLTLDQRKLRKTGYERLQKKFLGQGYCQGVRPHTFHRRISVGGNEMRISVDLLAG